MLVSLFTGVSVQFFFVGQVSHAAENDFTVRLETATHQISEEQNFFDLNMEPNDTDELTMTISNTKDSEQQFLVEFRAATTNMNGIVDYTKKDVELVGNVPNDIRDLISIDNQEITVPANSSQTVHLQATMPEKKFDGTLLGGIIVSKFDQESKNNSDGVNSKVQYVIAVQISQGETQIFPQLENGKVTLTQINKRNAVSMEIINPYPVLLTKVVGEFRIYNKKSGELIEKISNNKMSIAPNSTFSPFINLNDKFELGEYTLVVTLKNAQGQWEFSEDFKITSEEASKYNEKSVDKPVRNANDFHIIIGFLTLIVGTLFLLLIYFIIKKIRKS